MMLAMLASVGGNVGIRKSKQDTINSLVINKVDSRSERSSKVLAMLAELSRLSTGDGNTADKPTTPTDDRNRAILLISEGIARGICANSYANTEPLAPTN